MIYVIVAVVVVAVVVAFVLARRGGTSSKADPAPAEPMGPTVAEFHASNGVAAVRFDVPLAAGTIDAVLSDLLIRQAIEVVRDKRRTLPLADVLRVVAYGRRDGDWVEVGSVELDTPGTLPPPMVPELLPHANRPGFDAFERLANLPSKPPGLANAASKETLPPMGPLVRLPAAIEAGLRAQGLDPATVDASALVLGVMRIAGYSFVERSDDTLDGRRQGQRVFVRTVGHQSGEYPELSESQVGRFVVDFVSSGADRGLLITEKFSPFEVYERERREPRMRFITRERIQDFVDALAVG